MTNGDIAGQRLTNQALTGSPMTDPVAVVQWLGAVQAQDYAAAKWAVGLRLPGATDNDIEQAMTTGTILRTHVMRPTWHFVAPADIRWLLALTAPRVNATNAYYYRKNELDDATFRRSNAALGHALQGNKQLMRQELMDVLQHADIATDDLRFTLIMMRAELDGVICSGARHGKQFTYALLDERAPHARMLDHDAALAELTQRYFTSHGPATVQDFVWWSGLSVTDARAGLALMSGCLLHEMIDDQTYWFAESPPPMPDHIHTAHVLPNFDEYLVGYADRSAVFDASHTQHLDGRGDILSSNAIISAGRVIGTWKRTLKKDTVTIILRSFIPLNEAETSAVTAAAHRYGAFLGLSAHITVGEPLNGARYSTPK